MDPLIREHGIHFYNYNEFTNVEKINDTIKKASLKRSGLMVALKSLKDEHETTAFIKELQVLSDVMRHHHPHINQFYGISKDYESQYYLILQYADNGNLRDYLANSKNLSLCDKLRIAIEIAKGLIHLHENKEKIIHRNLHPKNILVHNRTVMISDFGISKEWKTTRGDTGPGVPAYVDPKFLADHKYLRDEKSDVYSFGVLLWEISSGLPPFASCTGKDEIIHKIFKGVRETPVEGTPKEYVDLYIRCWDEEPDNRPSIQEAFEILRQLSGGEEDESEISISPMFETPSINSESLFYGDFKPGSQEEPIEHIIIKEKFDLIAKWIDQSPPKFKFNMRRLLPSTNSYNYEFKLLLKGATYGWRTSLMTLGALAITAKSVEDDAFQALEKTSIEVSGLHRPNSNPENMKQPNASSDIKVIVDNPLVKTLSVYSEELEKYLTNECKVKSYDYSQFSDLKLIGSGRFAMVFSANFQKRTYALKSLNKNLFLDEETSQTLARELKNLYKVDHANVIKFHGISKDLKTGNFMLALQYANGGTLQEHLKEKQKNGSYNILWTELIQIANDIANGLKYLHLNGIIHRDLHSKNILINDEQALISDFGTSKQVTSITSSNSNMHEMIVYMDPQYILNEKGFKRNEKSDIYSLGILLWELTSGISPFYNLSFVDKMLKIAEHNREKIIANTPQDYANLYKRCWSSDSDQRPTITQILTVLEKLLAETATMFNQYIIINHITEPDDIEKHNREEYLEYNPYITCENYG
ncbi:kinase-like protein [Gigaspora margarita]|uniref:Kinase-like protein n=1 Tax=Gigaspora margarita TaxID=4874 RepID=A0A8H4EQY3_GIGMA|nr:kinase-like protein [Gigaspora margarita]